MADAGNGIVAVDATVTVQDMFSEAKVCGNREIDFRLNVRLSLSKALFVKYAYICVC